jgi:Predicted phosphatases
MSFQLIVFDLDGTLIDSRRDLADAANAVLTACGGAPLPEDQIGRMVGDGAATLVARAFAAAAIPAPPDALARFLAVYERHLLDHTRPYDGILDVLAHLARRAQLALLTNKPLASTREILRGLDLDSFFRCRRDRRRRPASAQAGSIGPGAPRGDSRRRACADRSCRRLDRRLEDRAQRIDIDLSGGVWFWIRRIPRGATRSG